MSKFSISKKTRRGGYYHYAKKQPRALSKIKSAALAGTFLLVQITSPVSSLFLLLNLTSTASAAIVCSNDSQGANDQPGQKDLSRMCFDSGGAPTSVYAEWNWDEISWPGGNTGDACALFDSDGDGNVNYAVCVTVGGTPAIQQPNSPRIYSCNDSKTDRCAGDSLVAGPYQTTCAVSQQTTDPFPGPPNSLKGDAHPNDTRAACTVFLSEVGGVVSEAVDVCSYPSQQPNSDPSDCVVIAPSKGKLEVRKVLDPSSDPGLFNLKINGTTYAANVGDGGTTGEVVVNATSNNNSNTASETAGTNTSLTNYTTYFECKDLNGTGNIIANGERTGAESRQITVPIADGVDVVCVITNTRIAATLTVVKTVINDNGGNLVTGSFPLYIDGNLVTSGQPNTIPPGAHTVSETSQDGYQAGTWGGDCASDGSVTLSSGQNATCTITNNDIPPSLVVTKEVVNDNGGLADASDFPLFVDSNSVTSGQPASSILANTEHTVSETNQPGYAQTGIVCSDTDAQQTISHPFTLSLGQNVSCVITNDDISPKITVTKAVTNDNGGILGISDFPLQVGVISVASGVQIDIDAGIYTVSELTQIGYTAGTWGGDCAADGSITLSLGGIYSCNITNDDDAPSLTLFKHVTNDNGGSVGPNAWTLTATGTGQDATNLVGSSGVKSGSDFKAGTYTLHESGGPNGYSGGSWSCTNGVTVINNQITLANGHTTECTVTNDDNPPSLTLVKEVTNNDGGNAATTDWTLTADGPTTISGAGGAISEDTFDAGTYTLSESVGPSGYSAGNWNCTNNVSVNGNNQITLSLGQSTTCTIINDDIAPKLTLIKDPTNDNGGSANPDDFLLTIGGNSALSGTAYELSSNTPYAIDETLLSGYGFVSISGNRKCPVNLGGTITLDEGDDITCTITNDDDAPSLTLNKVLTTDNGGTASESDWTLIATGSSQAPTNLSGPGDDSSTDVTSGTDFKADTYTLAETGGPNGYTASDWTCTNDVTVTNSQITLVNGQTTVCTITNDDIQPKLTVIKQLGDQYGNNAQVSDFPLFVNATGVTSGATNGFDAGTYNVSETNQTGYQNPVFSGDCNSDGQVTLNVGDNDKTCYITNNAQQPKLIVVKHVVTDNGGNESASDFTMNVTGTNASDNSFSGSEQGTEITLDEGSYSVDEDNVAGYGKTLSEDCTGTIAVGEVKTCTITNDDELPTLTVIKHVVNDNLGTATVADFDIESNDNDLTFDGGVVNGSTTTYTSTPIISSNTSYILSEIDFAGYSEGTWSCNDGTQGVDLSVAINLNEGEAVTCEITNDDQPSTVVVTKFNDLDENGNANNEEPALEGWTINLANNGSQITDPTGTVIFSDVNAGEQQLSEDQQNGWTQSNIYCDDLKGSLIESTYLFNIGNGQTVYCYVGNHRTPTLAINKTNNNPNAAVGDTVTYAIEVTVPEASGRIYGTSENEEYIPVTLTDLPPDNFTYVPGSWTANSNIRGDLKALGITNEPTYASPGVWNLTSDFSSFLLPGEIITLTYEAIIGGNVTPGTYPDLAYVRGYDNDGGEVLGVAGVAGGVSASQCDDTDAFASSCVAIQPAGQVLGASFTAGQVLGLADTGDSVSKLQMLVPLLLIAITFGLGISTKRQFARKGGVK